MWATTNWPHRAGCTYSYYWAVREKFCPYRSRRNGNYTIECTEPLQNRTFISNRRWRTASSSSKASQQPSDTGSLISLTSRVETQNLYRSSSGTTTLQNYTDHLTARIMRNIELIREGTHPLLVCEFSLCSGMWWRRHKSCVYDIYLLQRAGINEDRMRREGEAERLLSPQSLIKSWHNSHHGANRNPLQ